MIVLSAVIGGIILTVATIVIMILCRRSSSSPLKTLKNRDSDLGGIQRTQNGSNKSNQTKTTKSRKKNSPHFRRADDNVEPADTLNGRSTFLKSNVNGFDLGSNHPLISTADGPNEINEQNERGTMAENWTEEVENNATNTQQFSRSNGAYNEFSNNQVCPKGL